MATNQIGTLRLELTYQDNYLTDVSAGHRCLMKTSVKDQHMVCVKQI